MNLESESKYLDHQAFHHQQTIDFWRSECDKLIIIKDELSDEPQDSPSNQEVDDALGQAIFRLNYEMENMVGFEKRLRAFLEEKNNQGLL